MGDLKMLFSQKKLVKSSNFVDEHIIKISTSK